MKFRYQLHGTLATMGLELIDELQSDSEMKVCVTMKSDALMQSSIMSLKSKICVFWFFGIFY